MKSISEIRTEFEACRGSRAELYEMYAYDTSGSGGNSPERRRDSIFE